MKKLVLALLALLPLNAWAASPDGTIITPGGGTLIDNGGNVMAILVGSEDITINGSTVTAQGWQAPKAGEFGGFSYIIGLDGNVYQWNHGWSRSASNPFNNPPPPPPTSGVQSLGLGAGSVGTLTGCPNCVLTVPQPVPGPIGATGPAGPQGPSGGANPTVTVPAGRPITANDNQVVLKYTGTGTGIFPLPAAGSMPQWFSFCFKAQSGPMSFTGGAPFLIGDPTSFQPGEHDCIGIDDQNPPNWYVM